MNIDEKDRATRAEVVGLLKLIALARNVTSTLLNNDQCEALLAECCENIASEWGIGEREFTVSDGVEDWVH